MSKTRAIKFFLTVKDESFTDRVQSSILTFIYDNNDVLVNDYGKIYTDEDLGDYSLSVISDQAVLDFIPIDGRINDYSYSYIYYDTKKFVTDSSELNLGDSVSIATSNTTISSGISTTIVKIPEKFDSSKLIVELSGDKNRYEFIEINLASNSSGIFYSEYGRINSNANPLTGIGTYYFYKDGSNNINVDFYAFDVSENYTSNVVSVSLAKTDYVGIDTSQLKYASISSDVVSIAASSSPTQQIVATYPIDYQSAYYLIKINDITNDRIQLSELLVLNNLTESVFVEYGKVTSDGDLGVFDTLVSGLSEIYFTPNPDIDVQMTVYQQSIGFTQFFNYPKKIDLKNSNIVTSISKFGYGDDDNNRTNFDLTHKSVPIFERIFDGSNSSIINLSNNSIYLPNHFFVTGEKVEYRSDEFDASSNLKSIGIATTYISGIGNTDKLPQTCYIYKFDDSRVGLCSSPEYSLLDPPILFDFTSLGINDKHYLTSTKQHVKSLICIDNIIQSPIVGTYVTTTLQQNLTKVSDVLVFSGISSFFAGDLIQINDEIMKIEGVGVGSTNYITVRRPWLGTGISSHYSGDLVKKLKGNYNIVKNTIHFDSAPYGPSIPGEEYDTSSSTAIESLVKSTFQGRVFIRSANPSILEETYEKNYLFDDISNSFNSIQKTFELTEQTNPTVDFYQDSSIILVNNQLQIPTKDFNLNESGGKTNITFTGTATSASYDPNNASIPRGGIVVSFGSTSGFGYQPLISAGGTAIVSTSGTIQGVSIGNSGSGYRKDLQLVRVGIQTSDESTVNIQFIGTATVSNGSVVSVAITNPGIGYTSYSLIYDTITTQTVSISSTEIFLEDISKIPNSYPVLSIGNILNNVSIVGIATSSVYISSSDAPLSSISPGSEVKIKKYNPPKVIFDSPLSYNNIPLKYSGNIGLGTEATIDVVVGQGSSVIDFTISNYGYSYSVGDVLTLPTTGSVGIPTTSSFEEFKLTVTETFTDNFFGCSIGNIRVLDDIADLIDNKRKIFPLSYQGNRFSILSKPGSNIDVQATLIVLINGILQEPGIGYEFNGGSIISFSEPLKVYSNGEKDNCTILFYRGTDGIDVKDVDILETIKKGDTVRVDSENYNYQQKSRIVKDILSTDAIETNLYNDIGIIENDDLFRSLNWTKQRQDLIIEGKHITKDRLIYEPSIFPVTNIIKNVGIGSTQIYVRSLKTFFDGKNENNATTEKNSVEILSLDALVSASATATVNSSGEITSINLTSSGSGYYQEPLVYIEPPQGVGTTAKYTTNISNGEVISFNTISVGSGYTNTDPPTVYVSPPQIKKETISNVNYSGDFGIITGIATTSIAGVAQTGLIFDLLIEVDSPLRNPKYVDTTIQTSEIQQDYYFEVYNSNIGYGLTSISNDNSIIGIGTTGIDNVYRVASVSIAQTDAYGIGLTDVAKVIVSVQGYNNISGLGFSGFYGNYSWGLIEFESKNRKSPKEFLVNPDYGVVGINTTAIIRRKSPLKYFNYLT